MVSEIEEIFAIALEKEGGERESFLAEACEGDGEIRLAVQRMLHDAEQADELFGDATLENEFDYPRSEQGWEEAGDQIGPYVLTEKLGEGGFGVVWKAEQEKPIARTIALKVVKAGMDTKEVLGRFQAERQALALMDHSNIARVLDAGATETGRPYFVMELVAGLPITKYCDEERLGIPERLALFRDVCAAVNHAHQKGIIHRDLKPSNVLVTVQEGIPVAKVIDFGIAKATEQTLTEQTLHTQENQIFGTPVYMSPEQASLGAGDIDTRSDIYSLGVLLYELLSGRPPFERDSLLVAGYDEMRRIIREEDPPILSRRLQLVSESDRTNLAETHGVGPARLERMLKGELDWIVMKALEKDRSRRYETADAFAEDIERYLANEPVQAAAPSVLYRFSKSARRNKAALGTAALIAVVLVIATVVSISMAVRAIKAEQIALDEGEASRRASAKAQVALAGAAFQDADRGAMVRALETVPEDLRDQSWHYLFAKQDSSLGVLSLGDLGAVSAVAAVPNAPTHFAVAARSGKIVVVDVATGRQVMTTEFPSKRKGVTIALSADGALMAVTAVQAPEIHLFRVSDGMRVDTLVSPSSNIGAMSFSPDGNTLATRDGSGRHQVVALLEIDTGDLVWEENDNVADFGFSQDGSSLFTISNSRGVFKIRDSATGKVRTRADNKGDHIYRYEGNALELSPDGRVIALGLRSGEVVLINAVEGDNLGSEFRRAKVDFGRVACLKWTTHGHILTVGAQGGLDNSSRGRQVIRLWESNGFYARGTFFGMAQGQFKGLGWAFHRESGFLLTRDSPPRLFHIPVDMETARITSSSSRGHAVCFLDDHRLFARKGTRLTPIDVRDPRTPIELPTPARPGERIGAVNWPARLAVTGPLGASGTNLKLYAITDDGLVEKRKIGTKGWLTHLAFDQDGTRILYLSRYGWVFSTKSGEQLVKLQGHLLRAEFAGTGGNIVALAAGFNERDEPRDEVRLCDGKSGEILETLETESRLSELVVSPDRRLVAISGGDYQVRILDADTLEERYRFRAHDGDITALAFHPTEAILATASTDGSLKLWNYQTATLRRTYYGIDGRPVMLAFNPSGNLLALEAQEKHVRLYDLSTGGFPTR